MAQKKITELTETTSLQADDLFAVAQDMGGGTFTTKKVKFSNVTPSGVVLQTTDQTINGIKTFGSFPVTPSSAPTVDYQVANKKYVDDNTPTGVVLQTTDQTIAGTKTFTSFPILPSGVPSAYQSAHVQYVDDKVQSVTGTFTQDTSLLRAYKNATQQITSGNEADVVFQTVESDIHSAYDNSTGVWTAPKDMNITVYSGIQGALGGNVFVIRFTIYKNGSLVAQHQEDGNNNDAGILICKPMSVATGDTIKIRCYITGQTLTIYSGVTSYFCISEEKAGNFDPASFVTGTVELENDEYICAGGETSVSFNVAGYDSDDLEIMFTGRCNHTAGSYLRMTFNNDSGNNYDSVYWVSDTTTTNISSGADGKGLAYMRSFGVTGADSASGYNCSGSVRIMSFKSTVFYKTVEGNCGDTDASEYYHDRFSGIWKNTGGISSVKFTLTNGAFVAGTRFKIYGKKTSAYPIVEGNTIQVMQKIAEENVTVAKQQVDFTGLNGNTDIRYMICADIKSTSATSNGCFIRINDDATAGNYMNIRHWANGSTDGTDTGGGAWTGMFVGNNNNAINSFGVETIIHAKSGINRWATTRSSEYSSGDVNQSFTHKWLNTSSSINKISIWGNSSDSLGVGSHFELWAVRTVKIGSVNTGSGEWRLKERKEFTSAATSYTFSGLDGNSKRRYKLVAQFLCDGTDILASPNNDEVYTNYRTQQNYTYQGTAGGSGAQPTGYTGFLLISAAPNGNWAFNETVIYAKSGSIRFANTIGGRQGTSLISESSTQNTTGWSNTTDNITSLKIHGGIGIGSYIELWELAE